VLRKVVDFNNENGAYIPMKAKHAYCVDINGGSKRGKCFEYSFGHTKGIRIKIGCDKASIEFTLSVLKSPEDFTSLSLKLFRDALRKTHMLHTLFMERNLSVRQMSLAIDGQEIELEKTLPGFPFVCSMLEKGNIDLPNKWRADSVVSQVLAWTKTSSDSDYKACAMNAFLLSRTRSFKVDRFLNLWTSMNAVYNEAAQRFELQKCRDINKKRNDLPSKYKILNHDNPAMGSLIALGSNYILQKNLDTPEFYRAYKRTSPALSQLDEAHLPGLYDALSESRDNARPAGLPELNQIASDIDTPLFYYLAFVYPYHLRCKLFHGSKAINILSAYNDPEISDLTVVNFFLDRYLADAIPAMFEQPPKMGQAECDAIERFLKLREKNK
jgi:hypothetical protein